jgi:hypothetical protein
MFGARGRPDGTILGSGDKEVSCPVFFLAKTFATTTLIGQPIC